MKKILIGGGLSLFALAFSFNVAFAADVTIGNDANIRSITDTRANFAIVDTNHPANANGFLTSFSYYASTTNKFRFFVVDSGNVVKWVSEEITPVVGANTFSPANPVLVETGWNVGMYFASTGTIPFEYGGSSAIYTAGGYNVPVEGLALTQDGTSDRTYSFVATGNTSVRYDYDFITIDNGMNGQWATDYFDSTVTITPVGSGCYNVVREDGGTFEVIPGAKSPGGDGNTLVGNGTKGTISGGITMNICGTLISNPAPNTKPEDLKSYSGSYADRYFHRFFSSITSSSITDWGWVFSTCHNGTWTDNNETETAFASDPNAMGDIKGTYLPCSKDECKKDLWKAFGIFKNQGDCVSFTATGGKNLPAKNLTGKWLLSVNDGVYMHDMFIDVQNPDGTLSGHGGYPAGSASYGYPYNWTMTGKITGDTVTMTITYQNGYTAKISGAVSKKFDSMSGEGGTGGVTSWSASRV